MVNPDNICRESRDGTRTGKMGRKGGMGKVRGKRGKCVCVWGDNARGTNDRERHVRMSANYAMCVTGESGQKI